MCLVLVDLKRKGCSIVYDVGIGIAEGGARGIISPRKEGRGKGG